MKRPGETDSLFSTLRQSAKAKPVSAIEKLIQDGADRELCRINALAFAAKHKLDEEDVIAAFLHAARLGIFDMSWNILCPACGGVLDSGATLKTVNQAEYSAPFALTGTNRRSTKSSRLRSPSVRGCEESPRTIPGRCLGSNTTDRSFGVPESICPMMRHWPNWIKEMTLDTIELPAGEKVVFSLQLPEGFVIVFDPVVHMSQFIEVKGEPRAKASRSPSS